VSLGAEAGSEAGRAPHAAAVRGVALRIWAELGRTRLPLGRAVGLASGSVVELDRTVDEPVDLFVNGRRFASGRLLVTDDGEWAVRIEAVDAPADRLAAARARD